MSQSVSFANTKPVKLPDDYFLYYSNGILYLRTPRGLKAINFNSTVMGYKVINGNKKTVAGSATSELIVAGANTLRVDSNNSNDLIDIQASQFVNSRNRTSRSITVNGGNGIDTLRSYYLSNNPFELIINPWNEGLQFIWMPSGKPTYTVCMTSIEYLDFRNMEDGHFFMKLGYNTKLKGTLKGASGEQNFLVNFGSKSTIEGGNLADTIINTGNRSTISGGNGDDAVLSSGIDCKVYGNAGNDWFLLRGSGTVWGGNGNDIINSEGNYVCYGGSGDDRFIASNAGILTWQGDDGDDRFDLTTLPYLSGAVDITILDFHRSTNEKILLNANFYPDNILSQIQYTKQGSLFDAKLSLAPGQTLTVKNLSGKLLASDFVFIFE